MTTFACPQCGATPNRCGKTLRNNICEGQPGNANVCNGLICECADDCADATHGETLDNPCPEANCYHCGWGGKVPRMPRGLASWEKKALAAGWTPSAARAAELALRKDQKGG